MTSYRQLLKTLQHRIRIQITALPQLAVVHQKEARRLRCHDQARRLRMLRVEVMEKVAQLQSMESTAQYVRSQGDLAVAVVRLGIEGLAAAVSGSREHPLWTGIRFASDALSKSQPFGQVQIAVGPKGLPDEVEVIPVSRWARDQGIGEAEVTRNLEVRGYRLMEPEAFSMLLDDVQEQLLRGILSQPVSLDALPENLADS